MRRAQMTLCHNADPAKEDVTCAPAGLLVFSVLVTVVLSSALRDAVQGRRLAAKDVALTRDIKIISSAGARALADECIAGPSETSSSLQWRFSTGAAI